MQPKTSYTTWYESPTSTTPLSGNTELQNNATYYAAVQDESCTLNYNRLPVKVIIKSSPLPLSVSNFYFCTVGYSMTFNQLNINNNQNVRFYEANGNILGNNSYITSSIQYNVVQYSTECESEIVPFKVFSLQDTGPTVISPQTFCATSNPTIANIQITGQNIKWYDNAGAVLPTTTPLANGQTYYATQTINGCESSITPIQISINNTPKPTANSTQDFCESANPKLSNLVVNGSNLVYYNAAGTILPLTTLLVYG